MDQSVGGGVQDETHLVGQRRTAGGAVGGELRLVQLDQVLRLPGRAVEVIVKPGRVAGCHVGHDVAGIETASGAFEARDDALLSGPGFGGIAGLGVVAHPIEIADCTACAHRIGGGLHQGMQHRVAAKAEDEAHSVGVAPGHDLRPAVVTVAPDGDPCVRPVRPDPAHQPAQVVAHLHPGGVLPGRRITPRHCPLAAA